VEYVYLCLCTDPEQKVETDKRVVTDIYKPGGTSI